MFRLCARFAPLLLAAVVVIPGPGAHGRSPPRATGDAPASDPATEAAPLSQIADAVGRITQIDGHGRSLAATCFWISPTRLITNWHAIHNSNQAVIEMGADGRVESTHRMVRIIGIHEAADVAVIEVEPPFEGAPLTLAEELPQVGAKVRIVTMRLMFDPYIAEGVLERTDDLGYLGANLSIFSARPPTPGWSGSPIVDEAGHVVGINRLNGPVRANAAPLSVLLPLLNLPGTPVEEWSPEPVTPCGRSVALSTRAQHMPREQYAQRMALYRQAVQECPENFAAWTRIGRIAMVQGDIQTALHAFERTCELSPDAQHGLALAALYRQLGRHDDAMAERRKTQERDPSGYRFIAGRDRAVALAARGQFQAALPGLARALDGAPEDSPTGLVYARALIMSGSPADAIAHLERILRSEPSSMQAHILRGLALSTIEDWPRLLDASRDFLRVDPDAALGRAFLAEALTHTGRAEDAEHVLLVLQRQDPHLARITRQRIERLSAPGR